MALREELAVWWHLYVCQWAGDWFARHDPRWGWLATWVFVVCDILAGRKPAQA